MLESYFPIYQLALDLQALRTTAEFWNRSSSRGHSTEVFEADGQKFPVLLEALHQKCSDYGLTHTAEMAKRIIDRPSPQSYADMISTLTHLNDSLSHELEKEAVFRVPPERKGYYGRDDLFGPKVAHAFPSCARDIREAGNCYVLEQAAACVHHLMLVLERGLNALATKLDVPYERTNWHNIIENNASKLKSRGPESNFHREVNAQFGFLKDAYRNHSEHARDNPYDMPKALSILDHVKEFMQELEKGGLSE